MRPYDPKIDLMKIIDKLKRPFIVGVIVTGIFTAIRIILQQLHNPGANGTPFPVVLYQVLYGGSIIWYIFSPSTSVAAQQFPDFWIPVIVWFFGGFFSAVLVHDNRKIIFALIGFAAFVAACGLFFSILIASGIGP